MALIEDDAPAGVPEWIVTFGDMMSLLLTFFIMLVSFSETKQEEKYQAMVEAMMQRFGYDTSLMSIVPGTTKPRNAQIAKLATAGRAKRLDVMRGGDQVRAPEGDFNRVRVVRPGTRTTIGTVLFFDENSVTLSDQNKADLQFESRQMSGKPQKIEIRGHTSARPLPPDSGHADHWDLAYHRCRVVYEFMINELRIEPQRIRLSVAGSQEPLSVSTDPINQRKNPRVEVYLLDEVVDDLTGSPEELRQRFIEGAAR